MILVLLHVHSAPFASWHERFHRGRKRDARWPARWLDAALFEGHGITDNFGEGGVISGMEAIAARLHPVLRPHCLDRDEFRSEEHTSELQSLMRISYAVFCLKKKKTK